MTPVSVEPSQQEKTFIQTHLQKIIAIGLWALIAAVYFIYARANDLTFVDTFRSFADVLTSPIGPLVFILIYVARLVLFFPASVLTVAGGAIFGPIGVLWVVLGSNLSSLAAHFIGRFFGQGLLEDSDSDGIIQKYADRMRKNSFETVLIMRFIYLPYDLVSYLSGLLKIDWKAFILATALGSIPGTAFFTLFGAAFEDLDNALSGELPSLNPWVLGFSVFMFVTSLAFSRYFKRREGITD